MKNLPCLSSLEERLAQADGDSARRCVIDELEALCLRLAHVLAGGLTPAQARIATAAASASQAGIAVLQRWATGTSAARDR